MANNKNKIKNHRAMKIMEGHKKENNGCESNKPQKRNKEKEKQFCLGENNKNLCCGHQYI